MIEEIVYYCKDVSKETIVKVIKNGANSLKEIQNKTSVCTGNRCKELHSKGRYCSVEILDLLKEHGKNISKKMCSYNCC